MSSNVHETREGWLRAAVEIMRPWFDERGRKIPTEIMISVGFPKYGSARAIGQCWDPKSNFVADDGAPPHIFICPTQEEPVRVLDIILHELIHAAVGCECGHRGLFKTAAREFGLAGKMTATYAEEGTELHARLVEVAEALGPFPHRALRKPTRVVKSSKWIRLKSPHDEEYKVVISPKSLEEHGAPTDPWGNIMEQVGD